MPKIVQPRGQPQGEWRLAGASHDQISNAYDMGGQAQLVAFSLLLITLQQMEIKI